MFYLKRALYAELLKTKRTLAFWLALIAPTVVVGLQVAMILGRLEYYRHRENMMFPAWIEYGQSTLVLWGLLMLPLFVTLETALIANWEHRNQQWKYLFTLPLPRWTLYAAKQICGMGVIALSNTTLVCLIILSGLGFRWLLPGLGFEAAIPTFELAQFAFFMFLGSWLIIAIQTWVAQRWPSFAVASGVGIAMTVIGAIIIQSKYAGYYPYVLPVLIANGFSKSIQPLSILQQGVLPIKELLLGSLGGVIAAAVGGWHFVRRDVL